MIDVKKSKIKSGNEGGQVEVVSAPKGQETRPHDDVKRLSKVSQMLTDRKVEFALRCGLCHEDLMLAGRDNGGALVMTCGCVERRWL